MEQVRIVKEMRENERRNGVRADLIRPRYLVWENVVGAFSSNKGEDFKAVLEEIVRISKEDAVIPMPKDKKWRTSGCIVGDGFSVAWRVHDAQYWGVPQRRRRICIIADFNGDSAPYLLFGDSKQYGETEPSDRDVPFGHLGNKSRSEVQPIGNGLQGYLEKSKPQGQGSSRDSSEGVGTDDYERRSFQGGADIYNLKMTDEKACTITAEGFASTGSSPKVVEQVSFIDGWGGNMEKMFTDDKMNTIRSAQPQVVVREALSFQEPGKPGGGKGILIQDEKVGSLGTSPNQATVYSVENHPNDSRVKIDPTGKVQTLSQRMGTGGGNVPLVVEARTPTLVVSLDRESFNSGQGFARKLGVSEDGIMPTITARSPGAVAFSIGNGQVHDAMCPSKEVSKTLNCMDDPMKVLIEHKATGVDCFNASTTGDKAMTISSAATDSNHIPCVIEDDVQYIVRRLTPLECERLQGFPDGWTDIGEFIDTEGKKRKTSDAARYKALGNSIALPFWHWLIKRISGQYEYQPTMASLFDGIGGFPLVWQSVNGEGTCIWASEIEEFPIAVTKYHFGEGEQQ